MHSTFACCHSSCAHVICFEPEVEARLRRTHEFFRCPAGHDQHFGGETAQERTIRELKERVAKLEHTITWQREETDRLRMERWECRWSGCEFEGKNLAGLRTHMRAVHGMPALALVRSEEAS